MPAFQVSLAEFCSAPGLPPLNPEMIALHQADSHWLAPGMDGQPAARCSLWWRDVPAYPGHRLGLIGHYAAQTLHASEALLDAAERQLKAEGCTLALGPMDGSTWRSYRFVVERGDAPLFFLEPDHPDAWPSYFTGRGFSVLAEYFSVINPRLERPEPRLDAVQERLKKRGITLRDFRLDDFDNELQRIYEVSIASFAQNFLYTPIGQAEFIASYRALRAFCRPEMILLAEQGERPLGFVFAIPDLLQARRGESVDTAIIKTLAVLPEQLGGGLGGLLFARCEERLRSLGYRRAIHALMYQDNASRNLSARADILPLRRYALLAKPLP